MALPSQQPSWPTPSAPPAPGAEGLAPARLASRLRIPFDALLDWFYPPHCCECGIPLGASRELALCARCLGDLVAARLTGPACGRCGLPLAGPAESGVLCLDCRAMPPHFDCARAFFAYHSPAGALIRRYKFDGEFRLGPHLLRAALARGWLPANLPEADAVLPVPLHRRRLRERGFDQALLLARPLGRHLGCPVIKHALVRTRYTSQQTLLPMNKRWDNVRNAFAVRRPGTVRGLKLLLVDDVMTTGRTADECAKTLKRAGAAGVAVLTLCRTAP